VLGSFGELALQRSATEFLHFTDFLSVVSGPPVL
jgi:hypothetical protein